ncbi:MAG: glycosyltransferase [Flavobacteriaceae bacterium]|nr:glycosyltransferase [Flavobacteriaceae bacterium]
MKILLISMPSVHVIRWIENLKNTKHELYWFDVLGRGKLETLDKVYQITHWKQRKISYLKGEYWLSKKCSGIYKIIQPFLEITANEALEAIIKEICPDIIHSFEMQSCSYPILNTMNKYPNIKWIYSCWGSDLYYYQKFKLHNSKIRKVLNRINFLITDNIRDYNLAKQLDFKGDFLGVIPGGSGYKFENLLVSKMSQSKIDIILVKGYEHNLGRAINVLKALKELKNEISNYKVVVFGSHQKTIDFILNNKLPFQFYDRNELTHSQVLELMGKSKIYIGNSISDGMPNTLLEAMIMGAFPIQSNPGNVTAELIENGINGLLINNPEDLLEIKMKIKKAILMDKKGKFEIATEMNTAIVKKRLDFALNKQKIIDLYQTIDISGVPCE